MDEVEEDISALKKQVSEKTQAAGKVKKRITAKVRKRPWQAYRLLDVAWVLPTSR